ncbi:MAG: hypothetical protein PHF14_01030 [Verrucomicrobiota bacterium]|nr:hypothetical protein [Verrucomicrobiota bacterium]
MHAEPAPIVHPLPIPRRPTPQGSPSLCSRRFRRCLALLTALAAGMSLPWTAPAADAEPHTQRTYYVDSELGKDTNDGLSDASPWQSLQQINTADLHPGDTVRFKRGGVWRGTLLPTSGAEGAPVTYTSYGNGPKPLILGSLPRHRPSDWIEVRPNIWATPPVEYAVGKQILDLRKSHWQHHQEAGAGVQLTAEDLPEGRITQLACTQSGQAPNHIQVWGPELPPLKQGCLALTFRARSSIPFRIDDLSVRMGSAPWTRFGGAGSMDRDIGPEWNEFQLVLQIQHSAQAGKLHFNLGGILPENALFEFQPLSLNVATPTVTDPPTVDVGNIIFDHGRQCGWKKWTIEDLKQPYDYYYDGATWRVYLYSAGHPAQLHSSVELALRRHVVDQSSCHHVVYDGLAIKYGAAHGFGGGNTHHLVIRDCDLAYIGGGHQFTREDGHPVRFGNAIEFWGAAHDHLIEGCRIWEVYDAALTNQGRDPSSIQVNITYRNNLILNSEYSFEYWNHPESAITKNIRFVNNTCINAGTVWSHAQRPDPNGSHLMLYSNTAATEGVEIKYNIFYQCTDWGSRTSSGWETLPDQDYNLWYSDTGVMSNWFGTRLKRFDEYQAETGLDTHSRFADPLFVDPGQGDFRPAAESPARQVRPDGGPVGVESLFTPG